VCRPGALCAGVLPSEGEVLPSAPMLRPLVLRPGAGLLRSGSRLRCSGRPDEWRRCSASGDERAASAARPRRSSCPTEVVNALAS